MRGWQVQLCDPWTMRAIPERQAYFTLKNTGVKKLNFHTVCKYTYSGTALGQHGPNKSMPNAVTSNSMLRVPLNVLLAPLAHRRSPPAPPAPPAAHRTCDVPTGHPLSHENFCCKSCSSTGGRPALSTGRWRALGRSSRWGRWHIQPNRMLTSSDDSHNKFLTPKNNICKQQKTKIACTAPSVSLSSKSRLDGSLILRLKNRLDGSLANASV